MSQQIPDGFELREKCQELSNMILEKHPRMPMLLREIHTAILAQPEQVTLLSEEDIASIVKGLFIQTGTEFAAAAISGGNKTKAAASLTKKLNSGAMDLF